MIHCYFGLDLSKLTYLIKFKRLRSLVTSQLSFVSHLEFPKGVTYFLYFSKDYTKDLNITLTRTLNFYLHIESMCCKAQFFFY